MRSPKQILISLLTLLFLGYYGGMTLFPHVHEFRGRIIAHSHPYSGTPSAPQHNHTGQEIQWIDLLLQALVFLTLFCAVGFFDRPRRLPGRCVPVLCPDQPDALRPRLRDPPPR